MTSSDVGSTFKCSKDGKAFVLCPSPYTWSWIPDGAHTFSTYAVDPAGNLSTTWSVAWTVDATKPVVTITSGPPSPTTLTTATFTFTATDTHAVTFTCQLDSGSAVSCKSPKTYMGLAIGPHTFVLTGTDAAGNVSSKTWRWSIKS
jgi:hypothetical protein